MIVTDVSMCPYNQTDTKIYSFLGTHQPAIWMGTCYHPVHDCRLGTTGESGPKSKAGGGHVVVQASRKSVLISGNNTRQRPASNVSYPLGAVTIDKAMKKIYGWNDERQE